MKKSYIDETDKIIYDLIDVTISIKDIYNNLEKYEKENNKEKYNEYKEYLKIAIEVENNLYKKLDVNEENIDRLENRTKYLFNNNYNESSEHSSIVPRIIGTLEDTIYDYPFLSTKSYEEEQEIDNSIRINNCVLKDLQYSMLYEINNLISFVNDKTKLESLLNVRYKIIFINKDIENAFLNNKIIKINGIEKCLLCNQNSDLINEVYYNTLLDEIQNTTILILQIPDEVLKNNEFDELNEYLFIKLISCLNIINEKARKEICIEIINKIVDNEKILEIVKTNSNINFERFKNIFNKYIYEASINEQKQKKKK